MVLRLRSVFAPLSRLPPICRSSPRLASFEVTRQVPEPLGPCAPTGLTLYPNLAPLTQERRGATGGSGRARDDLAGARDHHVCFGRHRHRGERAAGERDLPKVRGSGFPLFERWAHDDCGRF